MTWQKILSYQLRNSILTKTPLFDIVTYSFFSDKIQDKVKIIFFSDLHSGTTIENPDLLLEEMNKVAPEFVLFGGDLASRSDGLEDAFKLLKLIPAKIAKFAVLGNWEFKSSRCKNLSYWRANFANAGFQLLHDSYIEYGNFIFYGISPLRGTKLKKTVKNLSSKKNFFRVIIAHIPDDIVFLDPDFDLGFAGHTHAGQIRFPFVGALKTSSKYWRHFDYGLYRSDTGAHFIISSGVGTSSVPIRFWCRPEIVLAKINF